MTEHNDKTDPVPSQQWKLVEKVVLESVREHRLARRWGIVFKGLTFLYLLLLLVLVLPVWQFGSLFADDKHVAVVQVSGMIADGRPAGSANVVRGLKRAFESESLAVVLAINSPGGSPVQSDQVFREARRLRQLHDKPLIAVIGDVGASGAYYIAASADEILADKASLVGSIGVISGGFGFVGTLDKIGAERRVFTAGNNKAMLDAFSPLKEDQTEFWKTVLETTHQQFVARVKEGRGDRLADDPQIFSGLIWSGEQALDLGLIDGFSSVRELARDRFDTEDLVDYTPRQPPLQQLMGAMASSFTEVLVEAGTPALQ